MTPIVRKLSTIPRTSVLCCPGCYRMVTVKDVRVSASCPDCGVTVSKGA
jgi:predicted RNA-binding Zn-ribbon protein involved in translation (DUF1610 family)